MLRVQPSSLGPLDPTFLAVYGSLRRRSLAKQGSVVIRSLGFHTHGLMRGLLFRQNGYPAVLEQPGLVKVEIYRVLCETVWDLLDRYEGYQHSLGFRALFYRKEVTLLRPAIRASVYFLGREIPRGEKTYRSPMSCFDRRDGRSAPVVKIGRPRKGLDHPHVFI